MTDNSDQKADASRRVTPIINFNQNVEDSFLDFRPRMIEPEINYDADFDGYEEPPTRGLEDVNLPDDVKAELDKEGASKEGEDSEIAVAPKDESVPEPAVSQASQQTPVQPESETTAPAPADSETTTSKATSTQKQTVKPTVSGSRSSSSSRKSG